MPVSGIYIEDFSLRVSVSTALLEDNDTLAVSDTTVGHLLSYLASFNNAILDARHELQLDSLLPCTDNPNSKEIQGYFAELLPKQRATLKVHSSRIQNRYGLSPTWDIPLQIAILTHKLYVPRDDAIKMRLPSDNTLADVIADIESPKHIPYKYPVIYPVYKVSLRQIERFIAEHSSALREALETLPEKPSSGIEDNTYLWGRLAWLLRAQTPQPTWAEIARKINDITRDLPEPLTAALTHLEARTMYERFTRNLQRLEAE